MSELDKMGLSHPELVKRFNALLEACWSRGWHVDIVSSTRTYESQLSLYVAYRAGLRSAVVANPDAYGGIAPDSPLLKDNGHWAVRGSMHMPQYDGYSHAIDVGIEGVSWWEFHMLAAKYGLIQNIPSEDWHLQWWTPQDGIFEAPLMSLQPQGEDDMDAREMARALGADFNEATQTIQVPLLDTYDPATGATTFKDFDFAQALTYTHQELKMQRARDTGTAV